MKSIAPIFFIFFALFIIAWHFMTKDESLCLLTSDKKFVYELRVKNGHLEHGIRHGGIQMVEWSSIVLSGDGISIDKIKVEKYDKEKNEYLLDGYTKDIKIRLRLNKDNVFFSYENLPKQDLIESIKISPAKTLQDFSISKQEEKMETDFEVRTLKDISEVHYVMSGLDYTVEKNLDGVELIKRDLKKDQIPQKTFSHIIYLSIKDN